MAGNPEALRANNQQGLNFFQQGKLREAQKSYQRTLKLDPSNAEALHLLGLIAHTQKDYYQAEKSIRKAIQSAPQYWQAHNNLSVVLQEAGKLDAAREVLEGLTHARPDYVDAQRNLGVVLGQLGLTEQSIKVLNKALAQAPDQIATGYALAQVYRQSNRLEEAVSAYQSILALQPQHAPTLYQFAKCLQEVGNHELALEYVTKLLSITPNDHDALLLSGSLLQSSGELTGAKAKFEAALEIKPDSSEALHFLAGNCVHQRLYKEAEQYYQKIFQSKGKHASAYSSYLMLLNYLDDLSPEQLRHKHQRYEKLLDKLSAKSVSSADRRNIKQGDKIRIGFVSADFYFHSCAYFFVPLIEQLNKERFEVYCFYNNVKQDKYTDRIREASDHWCQCVNLPNEDLLSQIKKDKIDVLVDLSGHSSGHRLEVFAHRAAPIQVAWLGYPNTTGLSQMDYRLVDGQTDSLPEAQKWHSERLIQMPNFLCYQAPDDAPDLAEAACVKNGYVTFGSFNNLTKIRDEVLELWAEILNKVDNSRLLLKSSQLADQSIKDRVLAVFESHGISPERIRLIARLERAEDHLKLYQEVDIGLDPFPYNGTTTTFEALWMGVPTIVMEGDRHASRVGFSIMNHLGLNDWVATDKAHYLHLAVQQSEHLTELARLKPTLRERLSSSKLCDAKAFARSFEAQIESMIHPAQT